MVGNRECNTERGFKNQLYIELGFYPIYIVINQISLLNLLRRAIGVGKVALLGIIPIGKDKIILKIAKIVCICTQITWIWIPLYISINNGVISIVITTCFMKVFMHFA